MIDGLESSSQWKKDQLNKITDKFLTKEPHHIAEQQPLEITSDDELQPMWRDMESRVLRRKSLTVADAVKKGIKIGRTNIRSTEEDVWLHAGLYNSQSKEKRDK